MNTIIIPIPDDATDFHLALISKDLEALNKEGVRDFSIKTDAVIGSPKSKVLVLTYTTEISLNTMVNIGVMIGERFASRQDKLFDISSRH